MISMALQGQVQAVRVYPTVHGRPGRGVAPVSACPPVCKHNNVAAEPISGLDLPKNCSPSVCRLQH